MPLLGFTVHTHICLPDMSHSVSQEGVIDDLLQIRATAPSQTDKGPYPQGFPAGAGNIFTGLPSRHRKQASERFR